MRQYWLFLVNCLCNVLFCTMDQSFSNGIDIDSVIVMGCFMPIEWLGTQFMRLGSFGYQTYQKYEKNCMLLAVASGIVTGLLCFTLADQISAIFDISEAQHALLADVLRLYGACMPMEAASRFVQTYITYKCYNRLAILTNVGTYFIIIGTDWLSVKLGFGLYGIIAATELSWLVYLIVVVCACKFWRTEDKIDRHVLSKCFWHAKDLLISRSLTRVAHIFMTRYVTALGEFDYAIYSVCMGAATLSSEVRDATTDYALVKLRDSVDRKRDWRHIIKRLYPISVVIEISLAYAALLFMHGKVALADCIWFLPFLKVTTLCYPVYDSLFSYFMCEHNTKVVHVKSACCCFWKIPMAVIVSLTMNNLIAFAALSFMDCLSGMLCYLWLYKRDGRTKLKGV